MSVSFRTSPAPDARLANKSIFLSASIPNRKEWVGQADALEITDAVVALARSVLPAGIRLLTAAHPTIAPLLVYVATELALEHTDQIVIYQSKLFKDRLPEETRHFERSNVGRFEWTPAVPGDEPEHGRWDASLKLMREELFGREDPSAAIFVGGMEGILEEAKLFTSFYPDRPLYAVGRPGGAARVVAREFETALSNELTTGDVYPAMWRRVVKDLLARS